jgi:hypothetical protein
VSRLRFRLDDDDDDDDDVETRFVCFYSMLTARLHSSFVVAIRTNVQYLDMTLLTSIVPLCSTSLILCYIVSHQLKQHSSIKGLLY